MWRPAGAFEPIAEFLATGEGDFWPQAGFWVLDNTDQSLLLAHLNADGATTILGSANDGTGWQTTALQSGGPCDLRTPLAEGLGEVDWRLDPAHSVEPDATTINLLATGRDCSSGQPMGERLQPPAFTTTGDTIFVTLTARQPTGGQECPGNPEEAVVIDIGEPVGDRVLVDGRKSRGTLSDFLPPSP